MAKKTTKPAPQPAMPLDTSELAGDDNNPRKISAEAAGGLRESLKRFGDLSGIVYNRTTGELVCGHQRMEQIRSEYGDRPVELLDEAAGLYGIRIDANHYFPVRMVDWSKAKQRAANVTANNAAIAGKFTKDVSHYLLEIEADFTAEEPGGFDDLLLLDLLSRGIDLSEDASESTTEEVEFEAQVDGSCKVVVDCVTEDQAAGLIESLTEAGWNAYREAA